MLLRQSLARAVQYSLRMDSIHVAMDTDSGVEALCGLVNVFAIYPRQLGEHAAEDVCPECRKRIEPLTFETFKANVWRRTSTQHDHRTLSDQRALGQAG